MEKREQAVSETAVSQSKKRGFTLTEIAIVLGIIGLILGAIWVAAAAVYTNMRISKSQQHLLQITQAIRSLYATSTNTGVATLDQDITTNLVPAGVFPSDLLPSGAASTTVNSAWTGATLHVYSSQSGPTGTVGDSFTVQFEGIPAQGCINLLASATGAGRDPGMVGAGGKTATGGGGIITATSGALVAPAAVASAKFVDMTTSTNSVSAVAATTACGTGSSTTAAFLFRLRV